jgi:hypothetical protein
MSTAPVILSAPRGRRSARTSQTSAGYLRHRIDHAHRKQEPELAIGAPVKG